MTTEKPRRLLGLPTLTALVIANMLGAGVFVTSGYALSDLGSANRVMLAWLIGGLIALCGALSYGGLVRRLTRSGGEYLFLSRVVHPLVGFIAGWISLLAGFTGAIAFVAMTLERYLPVAFDSLPENAIACSVVALAALVHGIRIRDGAISQNLAVVIKLGLLVLFIVYAIYLGTGKTVTPPPPPPPFSISVFAGTLVWISLSFSGFNAAVYVASEARNARVTVPKSLWVGTLLVTFLYLALNAVFIYLPNYNDVVGREDVAVAAAEFLGGSVLALVVRGLIVMALLTSVFSMVMAGPRVYARMAEDGLFPAMFRFRGELPRRAIFLQAVLAVCVILLTNLKELLGYLGFTLSLCSALTVSALFILRRREGAEAVPVVGYPFTPIIYLVSTVGFAILAARRSPYELLAFIITVIVGSLLFFLINRGKPQQSLD